MSRRTERVAAQLRDEVARLLREQVTDPRIGLVTLTRVDVAPDLSNAIVYYSVMGAEGEAELDRVDEGLHSAAPFLRRLAARELSLKRMPELRFRYDPSLSLGDRTLAVLRELAGSEQGGDGNGDPPEREGRSGEGSDGEEA